MPREKAARNGWDKVFPQEEGKKSFRPELRVVSNPPKKEPVCFRCACWDGCEDRKVWNQRTFCGNFVEKKDETISEESTISV
ncbi:MAG: hypothetical protein UU48_C0010G0033 [Candidatus Uhrbacteria bacterium GW2011_GWF2_41_16]|uniref:Uncharacterized protein n=2 Tax=Candidatus Uhriibacteriota TaxID=1752732 RepID=A0A0G0V9W3_9BACT|nr:MAG: hypothetical protein UU35_C0008G0002 [Candidatus Uhrbacteria bacterium GW2011_GWC2_41_11]KKR97709.1 MAG: hypothetical protein UU48_C0010G0033 [Candidatus Uhrbacteria bacterium GW2011_GWF2_41_16]HBO99729.1 hypothetical protein [Candidatus Uhrbacteria bacterium]